MLGEMDSESKKLKDDGNVSSSSSFHTDAAAVKTVLSDDVINMLRQSAYTQLPNGKLDLSRLRMDDSAIPELCRWLVKLGNKIKELILYGNLITSEGAKVLLDTLRESKSEISNLKFTLNKLDDEFIPSLGSFIQNNKHMKILDIGMNAITNKGVEMLSEYLDGNSLLKEFHLSHNANITNDSIPFLLRMIESSNIESLRINGTSVTEKNLLIVPITHNLMKCGKEALDLSDEELLDDDLIKICEGMKKYGLSKLNNLCLCSNKISSKGASILFDTLRECNSVISTLDLSVNKLDDDCIDSLGLYIQDNQHLENILIGYNKLTDNAVEILSESLIGNSTLKLLDLSSVVGITDVSTPHLIEIARRSFVTEIVIWDTCISSEKKQKIFESLAIPSNEREIPIKSSSKSAAKIVPL